MDPRRFRIYSEDTMMVFNKQTQKRKSLTHYICNPDISYWIELAPTATFIIINTDGHCVVAFSSALKHLTTSKLERKSTMFMSILNVQSEVRQPTEIV